MNTFGFATPFACSATEIDYALLDAIKSAGFDYVELGTNLVYNLSDEEFSKLCAYLAKIELPCRKTCALMPGSVNIFTCEEEALDAYIERVFDRFELLGVECTGFGSGAARQMPEGWTQEKGKTEFASVLKSKFLPKLIEKNMTMNIEPLMNGETNLVHLVPEAAEVLEMLDDARFGIVADTLHMMGGGEDAEELASVYMDCIRHLHISELERLMPVHDYTDGCRAFVDAFRKHGYNGSVSFETKCKDMSDLKPALDALKSLFA